MNLDEFTSGPPSVKPWLRINASHINVGPGDGCVSAAQYSQTSFVAVANTLGPSSITLGASHTGSLTVPPLPVGAVVRITATGRTNTSAANSVCNFGLAVDGGSKTGPTNISTQGDAISGAGTEVRAALTVYPSGGAVAFISVTEVNSVGPAQGFTQIQTTPFPYDNALPHAFDIQAYFNVADPGNNFTAYSVVCELINAN